MKNTQQKKECSKCFKTCSGMLSPFFINTANEKIICPCINCLVKVTCNIDCSDIVTYSTQVRVHKHLKRIVYEKT